MGWNAWIVKPFGFIQQASRGYKWGGKVNFIQLVWGILSVDSCECAVGWLFCVWNGLDRCFQIQCVKLIRTLTRWNVTHLVWRMKKCMNPHLPLPGSTSSHSSSSPYFSSSTSENEDAVQTTYTSKSSDVWLTVHRNSVWIKNQLDVVFVFFISLLIVGSTCFGQPCAHHQELTAAWCYSLVLVCAVAAGRWSRPDGR